MAEELRALVELAQSGDPSHLPRLRQILEESPEIWEHARLLASRVEHVWQFLLSAESPVTVESINRAVAKMRQELAGKDPTPLVQMLVERALGNWMELYYLQRMSTEPGQSALKDECSRRLESTCRKHTAALKDLATLRRLLPHGAALSSDARLFDPKDDIWQQLTPL